MMNGRIHRIVGATGAVLAALVASGAQAADRPNDRAGAIGVGGVAYSSAPSDVIGRAIERHVAETLYDPFESDVAGPVRPDDRPGPRGAGLATSASTPSTAAIEPGDGFAWGDAAFGAAVTFGLLVVLGALSTLTLRHRGRALAR